MAPLKFGDFSKAANDLIANDYCFDKKFKLKTKTANGLEITTEGSMNSVNNAVGGKLTTKIPLKNGITINKLGVTHGGRFFVDAGYGNVFPGVSLSTLVEDGGSKAPVGEVGISYKHKLINASLKVDAMNGPTLKDTVSANFENFHFGAEAKYNTGIDKKSAAGLSDYNVGAAFVDKDVTVSLKTKKKLSEFEVSVNHFVNPSVQVGAVYSQGKSKLLTFGGLYKMDAFTTFQGKVDSTGLVSLNAHQKVSPNLKLIASSQVDARSLAADSHKFGLQLHLS